MARLSPTIEGFRATFRRPSLTFAEIAWRWTVGATAWALWLFWVLEYLDTLPVSRGDTVLLSTRQPLLVGRAISHIFRGSGNRAVVAAALAALALACLWIVAASIGRVATVRALLDYFGEKFADKNFPAGDGDEGGRDVASNVFTTKQWRCLRSMIGLGFLRAAATLAALLALLGAAVLAGYVSTEAKPRPGLAFGLFLPLAGLVCMAWSMLNWLLSLAGMFAVRDGEDAPGDIFAAVAFFRERVGPVFAVGTWTGLAHLTAFSIATTAISMPLAFLQVAPPRLVLACVIVLTLVYFAVADWLYMARLAGYVCIAEMPEALASPVPLPAASGDQAYFDRPR